MALNYRELASHEADLVRQLHCLDSLLPEDMRDGNHYPQLFDNQDSLFSPDLISGVPPSAPRAQLRFGERDSLEDKQMFEEYLDSLQINEFIKLHSKIQTSQSKGRTKSSMNLENSLQCTFKPSILKKSDQIAGCLAPSFERLTATSTQGQKRKNPYQPQDSKMKKTYSKERIQRLSKPRVMKTEPCEVIVQNKDNSQKKYKIPRNSCGMDVATRNQLWQQQKENKIQKMRLQEQANKLKKESSTFAPRLTEYKGEKGANISQFGKEGMANYFGRVNMAKQKNPAQAKQNSYSYRKDSISPYASTKNLPKSPIRESNTQKKGKAQPKVKYQDAVKELHKKLMSLNI